MKDDYFIMRTAWGRKHGWELQRIHLGRRLYWRKSWRSGGCGPANGEEIQMWTAMPRKLTTPTPKKGGAK